MNATCLKPIVSVPASAPSAEPLAVLAARAANERMAASYAGRLGKAMSPLLAPAGLGDWNLALAAYNCGEARVMRLSRPSGEEYLDFWDLYELLPRETFRPGDRAVLADTPWGRIGLTVCYDLRFPELYRSLCRPPCDLICAPSAFTCWPASACWP